MSAFRALMLGELISYILFSLAKYKMFEKAKKPGWQAFVPFYSEYIYYQITWKTSIFWISIVFAIVESVLSTVIHFDGHSMSMVFRAILIAIVIAIWIMVLTLQIILCHKTSKAYGHGAGFTVGLIFLSLIFQFILGFGKSEYKGIQKDKEEYNL